MRAALAAAVSASVLALSACAGSSELASPTPSATSTPVESTAPSPSPSATPQATSTALDCPTWSDDPDFTAAAIGPISFAGVCVGQSFTEAAATGAPITSPDACPWYGQLVAQDDPGFYVSALSDPADPGASIEFFVLYWFADPADAASYEMPATAEGITIGSSAADVVAAYPAATELTFDDIARGSRTQVIAPTSESTSYNFDIVDGVVTEISWGENLTEGGPNGDLCGI